MASSHLKALLKKNWILWKRQCCCSILEIFIPVLFSLLFFAFRQASPLTYKDASSYYATPVTLYPTADTNSILKRCSPTEYVALIPGNDAIISELNTTLRSLNYKTLAFNTNQELDDYITSDSYTNSLQRICIGVAMIKNNDNHEYEYHLRYNISKQSGSEDLPNTNNGQRVASVAIQNVKSFDQYKNSGFLTLQNWIDTLILRQETNVNTASITAQVASVDIPPYVKDDLLDSLPRMALVLIAIPMLLPYLRMVNSILREKEKRIKEGMKIMGLQSSAFYLSWIITYSVINFICSLLISIVLKRTFTKHSSLFYLFLWHAGFSFETMAMGLLITVFFDKAKVGSVLAFVIAFASGWPNQNINLDSATSNDLFWASMGPASSVSYGAIVIFNLEAAELGLNSETADYLVLNYKVTYHYVWTAILFCVFLLLAAYLDQVLPSEFGVNKHPLFCLHKKFREPKKIVQIEDSETKASLDPENFEAADPLLLQQDAKNESIKVLNLKKVYSNGKLAVDGVNYNMYKGQIFALLGHNGAGKTTTINMITGLYPASSGTVDVFGLDISTDLDKIRKTLGVCPQHDVLFDLLTVQEHLELFAVFKGMDPKNFKEEIDQIISDLDLSEKRHYLAKDLSGGQKRKLSVGIAFVGGSQFILLDEPSSGLDTSARRKLWDMLKNSRGSRVILLTTHYMDEADFLGDRIAIMGEGKVQCLGSSMFLKNKFGVGYNLTIVKENSHEPSEPIIELVKKAIPECKVEGSNTTAEVSIKLPTETASKFAALFDDLDKNLQSLKISSYGVSVTTLEEVFLNVAKHIDKKKGVVEKQISKVDDIDNYNLEDERITGSWNIFSDQFKALAKKRHQYIKRDKKGVLTELLVPVLMIIIGIALSLSRFPQPKSVYITDNFYNEMNQFPYNANLPDGTAIDTTLLSNISSSTFNKISINSNTISGFNTAVSNLRSSNPYPKASLFVKTFNTGTHTYAYESLIDTRAQDSSAFAVNKINEAIIRRASGSSAKTINVLINPFPNTKGVESSLNTRKGFGIAFSLAIGMSFIPAGIITYITRERETNVKYQQVISGMSLSAYWISNFVVEYAKYLVPCILNPLFCLAFNAEAVITGDKQGALWMLFFLYGFSIIPFTYLTSFFFKDSGAAQTATFFLNFGAGFIGALAISILRIIDSTVKIAKVLQWFLMLIPNFSLCYGFLNLTNASSYAYVEGYNTPKGAWEIDIAGAPMLGLGLTSIIYFISLFVFEALRTKKFSFLESDVPKVAHKIDGDVEDEARKVEMEGDYAIKVKNMRKVFKVEQGHKVAVDDISFGIPAGECFALLGVNGAGKTTSFKMLTGEINPTSGEIFIKGYKLPGHIKQARNYIGYCPQFDALLENLTAREHLELYAALKGIPHHLREKLIQRKLKDLNLKPFENIPAGTYSGGNKRKLSVAMALLGNPPVIFLDEPSNGMDPEARRFMWDVISRISTEASSTKKHKSSVILTTHSMEEAEYLSTRIAIQVAGNLKCIGSAQHIKNRYGGGFEVEVKVELPSKEEIQKAIQQLATTQKMTTYDELKAFIDKCGVSQLFDDIKESGSGGPIFQEMRKGEIFTSQVVEWITVEKAGFPMLDFLKRTFEKVTILEHFQSFYRLKIDSNSSLGKVFGVFEENKNGLKIVQYSVRQTSLEQIFNAFANDGIQIKSKEDEKK